MRTAVVDPDERVAVDGVQNEGKDVDSETDVERSPVGGCVLFLKQLRTDDTSEVAPAVETEDNGALAGRGRVAGEPSWG